MKLTFSPLALFRTPAFSFNEEIENVWDELKTYIHESSPAFFEIIKDIKHQEIRLLEPKSRFTLWKYFNRAKFRATPYGNFATFSLATVFLNVLVSEIKVKKEPLVHRYPDWSEKEKINTDSSWLFHHASTLRANTSAYICGNELRYVTILDGTFELSAIDAQPVILAILQYCHHKRTIKEAKDFLHLKEGLSKSIITPFLKQLIQLELLLTDFHPNIIGNDYFKRIGHTIHPQPGDYIIAERKTIAGSLNGKDLQVLTDLTIFLHKYLPRKRNHLLTDFRNKFKSKFENQEVPLLIALDPEAGISYIGLAQDKNEDRLINELKHLANDLNTSRGDSLPADFQRFILDQMLQHETVQLDSYRGQEIQHQRPVANTMSILMRYCDDLIVTELIGGSTANSLLGRFSLASEEVFSLTRGFARTEQAANPGILFFDIAYQAEKHIDNVNRRQRIYDYELPILTWSDTENILDLDDLMISVIHDELILRSAKHQLKVVPRLASAYNYTRSDLPVFRFLSDMQHQNLHTSLELNIEQHFPGLSHYPRVQYKNVVLSPAKWLVPDKFCNSSRAFPAIELYEWLSSISINGSFNSGDGDQTLCFNPKIEEDIISFLAYCRNKKALYITEAFIPVNPMIRDENNHPYLSEFIINLEHNQQIYQPFPHNFHKENTVVVPHIFLPGSEWLYFEIYCLPSRSNMILSDGIRKYLSTVKGSLKNWFFLRYSDPSPHIRLRLQLKRHTDGYRIMSDLSKAIEPWLLSGLVSDLQVKTYRRELERYGSKRIHLVEKYFGLDSEFILNISGIDSQSDKLYAISINIIENVWRIAGFSQDQQLIFANQMADSFSDEMKLEPGSFKKINQRFKDFKNDTALAFLTKKQKDKLFKTINGFAKVLSTCNAGEINSISADLFHMHINRLFYVDQRMHEMVIYHFIVKIIKTRKGRQTRLGLQDRNE